MLVPIAANDAEFLIVFNRLCVALREPQDDTGITQGVYFDALKDLPIHALEGAATALARENRKFFPTTGEWRTAAELVQTEHLRHALRPARAEPWKHDCIECEDTGWVQGLACDGSEIGLCGRTRRHAPHDFTKVCLCRPTNRTYQRHQKFGAGA